MIITEAINAIYSWCYTTLGFVYATSANDSDTSHTICDRMIWSHKNLLIYPAVGCFLRLSVFPPAVYPAVGVSSGCLSGCRLSGVSKKRKSSCKRQVFCDEYKLNRGGRRMRIFLSLPSKSKAPASVVYN